MTRYLAIDTQRVKGVTNMFYYISLMSENEWCFQRKYHLCFSINEIFIWPKACLPISEFNVFLPQYIPVFILSLAEDTENILHII